MKYEKQTLHYCFSKAKEMLKLDNKNKARDYADMGIAFIANKRGKGYKAKDLIEDVRVELWLERFWMLLENNKLML